MIQGQQNVKFSIVNSVSPSCPSCWTDFHSTAINESDKCCKQSLCRWTGIYFVPNNLFPLSSAIWLSKSGQRIVTFFQWGKQPDSGLDSLNFRFIDHINYTNTHTHTPGRYRLNEWSARRRGRYIRNIQQTQQTNIHALGALLTRNQGPADLRLRPHRHREWPTTCYTRVHVQISVII